MNFSVHIKAYGQDKIQAKDSIWSYGEASIVMLLSPKKHSERAHIWLLGAG
jgi:hypothetical protein